MVYSENLLFNILATFTAGNATAEYRYVAGLETENPVTTTGRTVVEA
ncbi:hypothetical protein [Hymenobacter canadensis]|uniref:Uncharacterized protein n=1 Tax=Hymenobacter canadensis TaxID=2999067 RepID=A0ABY7LU29_9BACT|nr:hypothetical protein [Hymenobacter canadensis]WBA43918.1 hypothetical protein O3303_20335 [Hymenobacter canadensis]